MMKAWIKPLFVVTLLSLCFVYVWGCSFGGSSGGTVENPVGPAPSVGNVPTKAEEEVSITTVTNSLVSAMEQKDVLGSVAIFTPEKQNSYSSLFTSNPEIMPQLAGLLKTAKFTFLSNANSPEDPRLGGLEIATSGMIYHVNLVKREGQWLIEDF